MFKDKGYLDLSIMIPILIVLGLIGYLGITNTSWSELPWWVYVLLIVVIFASIVVPSHRQFPNVTLEREQRDED